MMHLEVENLASDYLESQLPAVRKAAVEAHLAACSECRELIADLRRVLELCGSAENLEPTPWLIPNIIRATVGQREPTLKEQLAALFRPTLQPRFAYAVAMAVFSVSIIVSAAGVNLQQLTLRDLNPRTWAYRATRTGYLLYARAEKFYYDLRVVYEIESRLRQLRAQPNEPEREAPKPAAPPGGSTHSKQPGSLQLASVRGLGGPRPAGFETGRDLLEASSGLFKTGRNRSR